MLIITIILTCIILFNGIGVCWYTLITSKLVKKICKGCSDVALGVGRMIQAAKGEPVDGTLKGMLKHYGFDSEAMYYKAYRDNLTAIQAWVDGLRARGFSVSWQFLDRYIDKIEMMYEGTKYKADIFFTQKGGAKIVKECIGFGSGEKVLKLSGFEWDRPEMDIDALVSCDESVKYLTKIKEEALDTGQDIELRLDRLCCYGSNEELEEELSVKALNKLMSFIYDQFNSVKYKGNGVVLVSGVCE